MVSHKMWSRALLGTGTALVLACSAGGNEQNLLTAQPGGSSSSNGGGPPVIDTDPLAPNGVRIIRSTTTKKAPDGRTYISEKTTTSNGTAAPEVRRAEPVDPPRKSRPFRLFKDDDDD